MATESVVDPAGVDVKAFDQPYLPSWIDSLMDWIEGLPGPHWLFYLVMLALVVVLNNGLHWLDGTLPFGVFHPVRTTDSLFPIYFLVLMHYLNQIAARALDAFRPLLDIEEAQTARLRYELTTIPAWVGLVTGIAALILGPLLVAADAPSLGLGPSSPIVMVLFEVALAVASVAFFFAFIYHMIHQLWLVNRIHRSTTRINLYQPAPIYAFSTLTVRTGIGLVFFSYYIVIQSDPTQSSSSPLNIGLGVIILLLLLSAASFILPLNNMHRLLVAEKGRLIGEANRRLEAALTSLYAGVDTQNLEDMDGLNKAISSLIAARDVLAKISTWPWETNTSRAFATAVLLPIILWLLTRVLDRVISF